ncbi:MAG: ribosome maturation factor RimP, partial [Candidatus Omnitrophota bacterium]
FVKTHFFIIMDTVLLDIIRETALPILAEEGAELVDFRISPSQGAAIVKFLVDKTGGITLEDCAQLNRRIAQVLEDKDLIQRSYILEVSSPGLDRPLVSTRDFQRCLGAAVKLVLHSPLNGRNVLSGFLDEVDADTVVIRGRENENIVVARKNIARAGREI